MIWLPEYVIVLMEETLKVKGYLYTIGMIGFCSRKRSGPHPATQIAYTQNNYTEIVLIKLLPGPLDLAFYWLTLTS